MAEEQQAEELGKEKHRQSEGRRPHLQRPLFTSGASSGASFAKFKRTEG